MRASPTSLTPFWRDPAPDTSLDEGSSEAPLGPIGNNSVDESAILGAGRPFSHSCRSTYSGTGPLSGAPTLEEPPPEATAFKPSSDDSASWHRRSHGSRCVRHACAQGHRRSIAYSGLRGAKDDSGRAQSAYPWNRTTGGSPECFSDALQRLAGQRSREAFTPPNP